MKRYCLTVDLKDDPELISEYDSWHCEVWEEIKQNILASGIIEMEIYRLGNRLFMIIETKDNFSFERKAAIDAANSKVQEWETMMGRLLQPLKNSKSGEKWVLMKKIYQLSDL